MDQHTDESDVLLQRWQSTGDRDALDRLLRTEIAALKARIRSQARASIGGDVSASDIAQEAVMRMLRVDVPPRFDNPQALRAYLWKAAWHLLAERMRRGRTVERITGDSQSAGAGSALATTGGIGGVERRDRRIALDVTIQLLEPAEQEILELLYTRGLELDEAARALGISRDAAKMRGARARTRLAQKLRGWAELIG